MRRTGLSGGSTQLARAALLRKRGAVSPTCQRESPLAQPGSLLCLRLNGGLFGECTLPGGWQAGVWGPLLRLHLAGPLSSPQGALSLLPGCSRSPMFSLAVLMWGPSWCLPVVQILTESPRRCLGFGHFSGTPRAPPVGAQNKTCNQGRHAYFSTNFNPGATCPPFAAPFPHKCPVGTCEMP